MRASVENPVDGQIPVVKITIVKGKHDLAIKVSDRGGGIPMDIHNQLFNYHYSTAPEVKASEVLVYGDYWGRSPQLPESSRGSKGWSPFASSLQ